MPGGMKLALSAFAVLVLGLDTSGMANPTISLKPTPPTAGGKLTITYTGAPGTKLDLDWDPASEPTSVVVDENGNAEVTVPEDATSLIVSDPTGGAKDVATTVYH